MKSSYQIGNQTQRLVFTKNKFGYGYCLKTKSNKGRWRLVSAEKNSLLVGPNFNLYPFKLKESAKNQLLLEGEQRARGVSGQKVKYSWRAAISFLKTSWFKFEVWLHSPVPLKLVLEKEAEPQIGCWLPNVSVQEEGGLVWNEVLIENPAVDCQGIQASDLPATYFYDPLTKTEWFFYLDWESLNWASYENIYGFLGGKCGLRTVLKRGPDQPVRERFLGFWPQNPEYRGDRFPKGEASFCFYVGARKLDRQPDQWQGLTRLIEKLTPLLKSQPSLPGGYFLWENFSSRCLSELSEKKENSVKLRSGRHGLRAYATVGDFASPNPPQRVELMTQADLVWPLFFYRRLVKEPNRDHLYRELSSLLPNFWDHRLQFMVNWYPFETGLLPQDQETWYFLENGLVKLGWMAFLTQEAKLKEIFIKFSQRLISLTREMGYLFPLRYDWRKKQSLGQRKNFVAAGLYSYGMCLAAHVEKNKMYFQEAERALTIIRQLPLDFLFHEPQQLGFAAAAAFVLAEETGNEEWFLRAQEWLAQQLRMFYWYSDRSLKKALGCDSVGMARSFPSKIYPVVKHNPAFKENVEAVLPWLVLLKKEPFCQPLLKFLNFARWHNFYFFDLVQGNKEKSFVPLEALPALSESGKRHRGGGVGHAIYGAGEVLWLFLLFEALATADDREILVVCLDYLDFRRAKDFLTEQNFLVYNPTGQRRSFKLCFRKPPQGKSTVFINQKKRKVNKNEALSGLDLIFGPQEYSYVKIR